MRSRNNPRGDLLQVFSAAIQAVEGRRAVRERLGARPLSGPVILVAVGKAAQSMTLGALDVLSEAITGGLVVSKVGHLDAPALGAAGLETLEAGHPIPDANSLEAGRRLLDLLARSPGHDILVLISGGASSLLEVPLEGFGLPELERANRLLQRRGLDIHAINTLRKALSRVKAGGLLERLRGRAVRALAISDVPGNDPAVIGSGLLVPDPDLAERVAGLEVPDWLADWAQRGLAQRGRVCDDGPEVEIVASVEDATAAAAREAIRLGYPVWVARRLLEGDAAQAGRALAQSLRNGPPGVRIWGGETTVRLPPEPGRGGRNQYLALAAALELSGRDDCFLLSAGTDGTDGPTDDAGALVDGGSVDRGRLAGLDPREALALADAGTFLEAAGDLIQTGPTGTNVMDLVIGLKTRGA